VNAEERVLQMCHYPAAVARFGDKKIIPQLMDVTFESEGKQIKALELCFLELRRPAEKGDDLMSLAIHCPIAIQFQTRDDVRILRDWLEIVDKALTLKCEREEGDATLPPELTGRPNEIAMEE